MSTISRREALKALILAFATAFIATRSASATQALNPQRFIDNLVRNVLTTLTQPGLSDRALKMRFNDMLISNFDMLYLANFLLGPYARSVQSSDKAEFQTLLSRYLVVTYFKRFKQFASQTIVVNQNYAALGNDMFLIKSELRLPDKSIPIDWVVYANFATQTGVPDYRIRDIKADGVSLALKSREDVTSYLRQHGGDLDRLNGAMWEDIQRNNG